MNENSSNILNNDLNGGSNNYDDYDDEDDDDFRGAGAGGPGFMNDLDFITWDLIVKNTPKLP